MKNLAIGIVICMVLFSCKKESEDLFNPAESAKGQKYKISYNFKDFSPQIAGVKSNQISEIPLNEKVSHIVYLAYNEEGKEVSRIRQRVTGETFAWRPDENDEFTHNQVSLGVLPFGTFTDSLATGNYTIVMIASQAEFGIGSYNEPAYQPFDPLAEAYFIYEYRFLENRSRTKDTFYKKFQLKVEDKELNQEVLLERIVAKAEINILDAKPDVGYRFSFINEFLGFRFSDNKYVDGTDDSELGAAGVVRDNTKFSAFILNTDPANPIDIVIEAFQGPGRVSIAKKTIENVPFVKNKRTVLTGNMHSGTTPLGFSVTVCDEFDQDTINVTF